MKRSLLFSPLTIMKNFSFLMVIFFLLLFNIPIKSQVTNLMVNGSSSSFVMTSGDVISWSYNVPTSGAITFIKVWYDVNVNKSIDAGDVLYQSIEQTDNDTLAQKGAPDMNHIPGKVSLSMPVGLAPGNYVLSFTNGSSTLIITGTVNGLSSPAYKISGTVTPPEGRSAANIFIEVHRSSKYQPSFWDAVTDAYGNFTIEMTSDTLGNPWTVELLTNPFPPNIISPKLRLVTISRNLTGINFGFLMVVAKVAGTLKDENGNIIANTNVNIKDFYGFEPVNPVVKTNSSGNYQIGLTQSDLSKNTRGWNIFSFSEGEKGFTTNRLDARAFVNSIAPGDSIIRNLVVYNANSTISGKVTINGLASGYPIQLVALNQDSAQTTVFSNASTGSFSLPVTNKIYNYYLIYIDAAHVYYGNNIIVHPGDSNVHFNLTTTPVAVKQGFVDVPQTFLLCQNYPNPFNPSTTISFQIPVVNALGAASVRMPLAEVHVTLKVYDVLGREVVTLVNEEKLHGSYQVKFDGSNLTSGIYFYQLQARDFLETKKFVLVK